MKPKLRSFEFVMSGCILSYRLEHIFFTLQSGIWLSNNFFQTELPDLNLVHGQLLILRRSHVYNITDNTWSIQMRRVCLDTSFQALMAY